MTYGHHEIITNIPGDAGGFIVGRLNAVVLDVTDRAAFYIDRTCGRYAVQLPAHEGGAVLRDVVTALDHEGLLG